MVIQLSDSRPVVHRGGRNDVSLFEELKRRNVFRAGIAFLIVSWVLAQVADLVLDNIGTQPWLMQTTLLILGLGFLIPENISAQHENLKRMEMEEAP